MEASRAPRRLTQAAREVAASRKFWRGSRWGREICSRALFSVTAVARCFYPAFVWTSLAGLDLSPALQPTMRQSRGLIQVCCAQNIT